MRHTLSRIDLRAGFNGAISGLVAIAAGPEMIQHHGACTIGAVGCAVCTHGKRLLERLRIDGEVGTMPAHLSGGRWGTAVVFIPARVN